MGIDVYHGTGPVNWGRVRDAGHSFGIVKATEGITLIDANLGANLSGLADAGMVRGAYHFFHVGVDPMRQAFHFLNALRAAGYDTNADMPVVLDLEDRAGTTQMGVGTMRTEVSIWLHTVEQATGKVPIIYTDVDFGQNLLGEGYGGHPLWIANYTSAPQPRVPSGWSDWTFWQYSESGSVDGVNGNVVDLNNYNGDEAALRAWVAG